MGRAERRLKQRLDLRYEKEQSITLNKYDLAALKQKIADQASSFSVESYHYIYALVLARRGLENDIPDIIGEVDDMIKQVLNHNLAMFDVRKELEEVYGFGIKAT